MAFSLRSVGSDDADMVLGAGHLFDRTPDRAWTDRFLRTEGHHLILAFDDTIDEAIGFVTGIEIWHPDKGVELLIQELGVDEVHRRQGVGRALVDALRHRAEAAGCRGLWVATESDNEAALATYRAAGFSAPETAVIAELDLSRGES